MILILYYFLVYFGLGIFLNFLLLYFLNTTPLIESQVTFIMSLVPILNLFSTNFFAYLSDRFKKHRLVLAVSIIFSVISTIILYLVSQAGSLVLIVLMYYVLSFFMQAPTQLIDNFAFEYGKENDFSFGQLRAFGSLGYAIAGFVGGYLTHQFGLSIIFIVFSLTFLLSLFLVRRLPEISSSSHESTNETNLYKQLFAIKEYYYVLILSFLMMGATSSMASFFSIYIQNYAKLDLKFLGLTVLISAGSEVPMMFMSDKMIEKLGAYRVLMLASFFTFVRFIVYVFFPSKFWILLVSFTHGIGHGSTYTAVMHLIEKHIPLNIRSIAISFNFTFAVGFGTFVIISFVSFLLDAQSVFILLAGFEVMAFMIAYRLDKKELGF